MNVLIRALSTFAGDAKASLRCTKAFLDASGLKRKRKKEEKALKLAYHEVGTRAADKEKAKERKSFGSVEEDRERAAGLDAALTAAREAEEAAKAALFARGEARKVEIDRIDDEYRKLADAHGAAKDELAGFVRKMRELDDDIERPEEKRKLGRAVDDMKAEIESLRPGREEAQKKEEAARATRDAKKEELDAEKKAWKEEETELTKTHWAAIDAREAAERVASDAHGQLDGSLEDLGKSVALAGMTDPDLAEPLAKAKGHMKEIQSLQTRIDDRKAEMKSVKTETTRFTLVTAGLIVVIVVALILIF